MSARLVEVEEACDGSEAGLVGKSLSEYSFVLEISESISQSAGEEEQCNVLQRVEMIIYDL